MIHDLNWCVANVVLDYKKQQRRAIVARHYAKHKERLIAASVRRRRDLLRGPGGDARRARDRENYRRNKAAIRERKKANWKSPENIARRAARAVEYSEKRKKLWKLKYKAAGAKRNKLYYEKNRASIIAKTKAYELAHPGRWREYARKRYHSDPQFKMSLRLRSRLNQLVGPRKHRASVTLKLNRAELVAHIERKFLPGMTWANHGNGPGKWHIDHIIPCAEFNLTDQRQIGLCFALTNLQPLWSADNIKKSAKLMRQSEFSLA